MGDDLTRLRRLFLFDGVCQAGGIGQAAATVGLSQPAVSLALAKLEASFGATLLERGYGGSDLTPAGQLLHRRVRRMLDQMEGAVAGLLGGVALPSVQVSTLCRHLTDSQVRCHIAIAHTGSAADAARRLGVSQPAVHRAARALEQSLGVTLYRRRVHSVSANLVGVEFARRLSLALYEIGQAAEEIASALGRLSGRIAVGMLPLLPQPLMARTTGQLLKIYPDATVILDEGSREKLLSDLRYGVIDFIVGALRQPHPHDAMLDTELFTDPYMLVVRRGHRLAGSPHPSGADLASYDWVVPPPNMPRRDVLDTMLVNLPHRPRAVIETSSLAMMMAMLAESDCITLLPRSHIREGNSASGAVALAIDIPEAHRTVGLTIRADWLATQAQQAFMTALREQCASGRY